jgi:ankyrin repeat protein
LFAYKLRKESYGDLYTDLNTCRRPLRRLLPLSEILANKGADLDTETKAGYTPLHVASHFGSANMVRFLLDREEVRVDVQNELGYTPLHQAAQQGHSQIVNLLLEKNASPNYVSNVSRFKCNWTISPENLRD